MPLQELPCLSLSQSKGEHKRKCKEHARESQDTECTPVELIQQLPPLCKHRRLMGKENESNQFILGRRSRRKVASTSGRDHICDGL